MRDFIIMPGNTRNSDRLKNPSKDEKNFALPPPLQLTEKKAATAAKSKSQTPERLQLSSPLAAKGTASGGSRVYSGKTGSTSSLGKFNSPKHEDESLLDQEISEAERSIRETEAQLEELEKHTRLQSKREYLAKIKAKLEHKQQKLRSATEKARRPLSVTILSDSTAKYVTDIHHTTSQAFRGADIAHILYKIKHNKASIYSKYTIVLTGTNDVASSKSVDDIMSLFQTLITRIRSKSSTNLIISGIIPRPCDLSFDLEEKQMKKVNQELERLCKQRKVPFLHTYRIVLYKNKPIQSLFAIGDNDLHLNFEGSRRLSRFFHNAIIHLK